MSAHMSISSKRINVLTLDGGGVRGLSTLLILRSLMEKINQSIRSQRPNAEHREVKPHEIFDLVAGTSTGGLIAVMLGKLGMTVDQCIQAYRDLSAEIFGKKHMRARVSGGLAHAKYSGLRLRDLMRQLGREHRSDEDLKMFAEDHQDAIACALICREHRGKSRYSNFKPEAVCICSLRPCPDSLDCLICDGARATSAAPTFFPVQEINGRYFADGGLEFNNPSHKVWDHYRKGTGITESHRSSVATEMPTITGFHGNLDFSDVRIINLGTGTEPSTSEFRENNFAFLVPGALRMFLFLKRNLTKIATNSERVAGFMETIALVSTTKYERFSADNGVCFIKLDKYKKLAEIERLTLEYLRTDFVTQKIGTVAGEIAGEYVRENFETRPATTPDRLSVPLRGRGRPNTPVSVPTRPHVDTPPSTRQSMDHSDATADNTPSKQSTIEAASTTASSVEASPSRKVTNMIHLSLQPEVADTSPVDSDASYGIED